MNTRETRGYLLTFRCVNCGKHELFAKYAPEGIVTEAQIRGRIYQVTCTSCGWQGQACGMSAVHVSHIVKLEAKVAGQGN